MISPAALISLLFAIPIALLLAIIGIGLYTNLLTSKLLDLLFLGWIALGTIVITVMLIFWW